MAPDPRLPLIPSPRSSTDGVVLRSRSFTDDNSNDGRGLFKSLPAAPKRPLTYAEYLRSPVWKAKRAAALQRDGHACRCCPATERLEVHHRRYPEVLGEEPLEDLTTLCSSCHAIVSWFRKRSIASGSPRPRWRW